MDQLHSFSIGCTISREWNSRVSYLLPLLGVCLYCTTPTWLTGDKINSFCMRATMCPTWYDRACLTFDASVDYNSRNLQNSDQLRNALHPLLVDYCPSGFDMFLAQRMDVYSWIARLISQCIVNTQSTGVQTPTMSLFKRRHCCISITRLFHPILYRLLIPFLSWLFSPCQTVPHRPLILRWYRKYHH